MTLLSRLKRFVREQVLFAPLHGRRDSRSTSNLTAADLIAGKPEHTLIVAAHPDDDMIAAACLLGRLPKADVLYVTDGAPRDGKGAREAGFADPAGYAEARRQEAAAALALLGPGKVGLIWLAIPDQEARSNLVDLTRRLIDILP